MTLRVIDTEMQPARWNIAVSAALTELHLGGHIPDTLRFHRYPRSALVGRHQNLAQEVDVAHCRKIGVGLARRITGGGAVYMSPGILAWDIVAGRHRFGTTLEHVSRRIGTAVAAALVRLGLDARLNGGAVEIDGRKVCGFGGAFEGSTVVMQASLLIDFDRDEMAAVLKPSFPPPRVRVGSLADFLGSPPSIALMQAALVAELSDDGRGSLDMEELRRDELALADKLLAEEIGTDAFVMDDPADHAEPLRRKVGS